MRITPRAVPSHAFDRSISQPDLKNRFFLSNQTQKTNPILKQPIKTNDVELNGNNTNHNTNHNTNPTNNQQIYCSRCHCEVRLCKCQTLPKQTPLKPINNRISFSEIEKTRNSIIEAERLAHNFVNNPTTNPNTANLNTNNHSFNRSFNRSTSLSSLSSSKLPIVNPIVNPIAPDNRRTSSINIENRRTSSIANEKIDDVSKTINTDNRRTSSIANEKINDVSKTINTDNRRSSSINSEKSHPNLHPKNDFIQKQSLTTKTITLQKQPSVKQLLNQDRYTRYSFALSEIQEDIKSLKKQKIVDKPPNIDYSNKSKSLLPISHVWNELLTYYFATFRGDEKILEAKLRHQLADYDYSISYKHIRKNKHIKYMKRTMAQPVLEDGGFVEKCTRNNIYLYNKHKKWKINRQKHFIFVYRYNDKIPVVYEGDKTTFRIHLEGLLNQITAAK